MQAPSAGRCTGAAGGLLCPTAPSLHPPSRLQHMVHFDVKSSNLLLGYRDRRPVCKVGGCGRREGRWAQAQAHGGFTSELPSRCPQTLVHLPPAAGCRLWPQQAEAADLRDGEQTGGVACRVACSRCPWHPVGATKLCSAWWLGRLRLTSHSASSACAHACPPPPCAGREQPARHAAMVRSGAGGAELTMPGGCQRGRGIAHGACSQLPGVSCSYAPCRTAPEIIRTPDAVTEKIDVFR